MKKHLLLAAVLAISVLLSNCQQKEKTRNVDDEVSGQTAVYGEGFEIVSKNCISCHSPKPDTVNKVAPPLTDIKLSYTEKATTQKQFVTDMANFLVNPEVENSKMPEAIERYGLMPNLGYTKEQYQAVAAYLFQAPLENTDWFETQYAKDRETYTTQPSQNKDDYLKRGLNLALATKAELGKNLLNAIKTKGTADALGFCHEKATYLTDSMATTLKANIRRVSDKNRNPKNAANPKELKYIEEAKEELTLKGQASPMVYEEGSKMIGYYPIITNAMCLQCHGTSKTEVESKTLTRITQLYPNDKAMGYTGNQLRGIWVVEMDKDTPKRTVD